MTVLSIITVTFAALTTASASEGYYGCGGDCVETYDKCSGGGSNAVDGVLECCSDDNHCVMKNEFFSQCRPIRKDIPRDWDGTILTCDGHTHPPAPTACVEDCVDTFDKCAGKGIDGLKSCCSSDDHCVMKNRFFSACRPRDRPLPDGWAGVVVDCTRCGPSSAEVGEFINEDLSCDVDLIGDYYTLDDCDTVCADSGFPACDRPANAGPNVAAACYGYIELSPGTCSMRSTSDDFWLSWLTCREGGVPVPAGGGGSYGDDGDGDADGATEAESTVAADSEAAEEEAGDDVAGTDVASASGRVG